MGADGLEVHRLFGPAGLDLMAWGVVQMTSKFAVRANES